MRLLEGKKFYSMKELRRLLGRKKLTGAGVFTFLRSSRIKCANVKGKNYISREDILKSLNPNEKADKPIIERILKNK